jgi:hypothetical protein
VTEAEPRVPASGEMLADDAAPVEEGPPPEPSEPMTSAERRAILTTVLTGAAFMSVFVLLDVVISQGEYRLLSAALTLAGLGVMLAVVASMWTREPEAWKHLFIPQNNRDLLIPRVSAVLNTEFVPDSPVGRPERVMAAVWVREVLTERLMLARSLTPSELNAVLERPEKAPALENRPSMRRFLGDTRDMGTFSKGNILAAPRKEFLKLTEGALSEADSL